MVGNGNAKFLGGEQYKKTWRTTDLQECLKAMFN